MFLAGETLGSNLVLPKKLNRVFIVYICEKMRKEKGTKSP
jgi:hypothetical protein